MLSYCNFVLLSTCDVHKIATKIRTHVCPDKTKLTLYSVVIATITNNGILVCNALALYIIKLVHIVINMNEEGDLYLCSMLWHEKTHTSWKLGTKIN